MLSSDMLYVAGCHETLTSCDYSKLHILIECATQLRPGEGAGESRFIMVSSALNH